jgi:hypothetical protein
VVKARDQIAAARLPPALDGLREFRRRVMGGGWRRLMPLTEWEDFWSASLLRDLCFHVQAHRFTISRLRDFMRGVQCNAPWPMPDRLRTTARAFLVNEPCPILETGNNSSARSRTCFLWLMPSSVRRTEGRWSAVRFQKVDDG